jgi:hypothetical protein
MNGWAILVPQPRVKKSQIAALVPPSLRAERYPLYLLGMREYEDMSLYVCDEWVAYTNGATVGVDRYVKGIDVVPPNEVDDTIFALLEFSVYSLTAGMAASVYDPAGFATNAQLRAFLAWQSERAMTLFRSAILLPAYRWTETDGFYAALLRSPDAETFRQFVRTAFGAAWAYAVFGF